MQTFTLHDAFGGLVLDGRTQFKVALPVDAVAALEDDEGFVIISEAPLTNAHLANAVIAEYARIIRNDPTRDALTGPVVTARSFYNVDGEVTPFRPKGQDAKGKVIVTLPGVIVQSREQYRSRLPESIRGLVQLETPAAWTQAETDRASKALPAGDAKPVPQNALSDGKLAAFVLEPLVPSKTRTATCTICHQTRTAPVYDGDDCDACVERLAATREPLEV